MTTSVPLNHVGGLTHLMEAATVLAKMTSNDLPMTAGAKTQEPGLQQRAAVIIDEEEAKSKLTSSSSHSSNNNNNNAKREIFPQRLIAILNDPSLSDVVTWLPNGRSFVIIRPDVFAEKVLPKYLPPIDARGSTKYPSFTRKLNRWGFRQATRGPDTGAFHHPLFRRDQPELCLDMICQRSRDRKPEKKNSSLPLKKRRQESDSPVAPLTKESLESFSSPKPKKSQPSATVSVTDDSRSIASNSTSTASTTNSPTSPVSTTPVPATIPLQRGITTDASIIAAAVKQREEMERLRIAKAMLYESYMKALRGE